MGGGVLNNREVPRATIGRIPTYLRYLKSLPAETVNISATILAKGLGLGEVQVRKDLSAVSGAGRPKTGYRTADLIGTLEKFLGVGEAKSGAIIVGAGKLGRTLLDYGGFSEYGLEILAAFDITVTETMQSESGKPIYPMEELDSYCRSHAVKIGVITVPAAAAQGVCDRLLQNRISAIWCFAPCVLTMPEGIPVRYENMALSLACLNKKIQEIE